MKLIKQLEYIRSHNNDGHLDCFECTVLGEAIVKMKEDLLFRREWANRFGFLANNNPRDSYESIDEVATLIYNRDNA